MSKNLLTELYGYQIFHQPLVALKIQDLQQVVVLLEFQVLVEIHSLLVLQEALAVWGPEEAHFCGLSGFWKLEH